MTITVLPSRNEYTANAGQTVFNYTFKIFESTDLNVYVTPAGQECSDSDLTTAYTVTGIGDPAGGSITLNTPTSDGDLVTIVSAIPSERTTDYQNNGDFRPDTVNEDFDRVVSIVKKIEDKVGRSPSLPECYQGDKPLRIDPPLAGNSLVFNGQKYVNYKPSETMPSIPEDNLGNYTGYYFENLLNASLGLALGGFFVDLSIGNVVETIGRESSGDGGSARYVVVPGGTGENDGLTFINTTNDLQLQLISTQDQTLFRSQVFGIFPNNTDIGPNLRKALKFCTENKIELRFQRGKEYLIGSINPDVSTHTGGKVNVAVFGSDTHINLNGAKLKLKDGLIQEASVILNTTTGNPFNIFVGQDVIDGAGSVKNVKISNGEIDYNGANNIVSVNPARVAASLYKTRAAKNMVVERIKAYDNPGYWYIINQKKDGFDITVRDCEFGKAASAVVGVEMDHSTIYARGQYFKIYNNTFGSEIPEIVDPDERMRAAIDSDAIGLYVHNNVCTEDYTRFVIAANEESFSDRSGGFIADDIIINDNSIKCEVGLNFFAGSVREVRNVQFIDNICSIPANHHSSKYPFIDGITNMNASVVPGADNLAIIKNLSIQGNIIEDRGFGSGGAKVIDVRDYGSISIRDNEFRRTRTAPITLRRPFNILAENPSDPGVILHPDSEALVDISDNKFIKCVSDNVTFDSFTVIEWGGDATEGRRAVLNYQGNMHSQWSTGGSITAMIRFQNAALRNCVIADNTGRDDTVRLYSGNIAFAQSIQVKASNIEDDFRRDVNSGAGGIRCTKGSTIQNKDAHYVNRSSTGGLSNEWLKTDYGTSQPTSGKWLEGDERINTAVGTGGVSKWVCSDDGDFSGTTPLFVTVNYS